MSESLNKINLARREMRWQAAAYVDDRGTHARQQSLTRSRIDDLFRSSLDSTNDHGIITCKGTRLEAGDI